MVLNTQFKEEEQHNIFQENFNQVLVFWTFAPLVPSIYPEQCLELNSKMND